jgi:uncharacterized protein
MRLFPRASVLIAPLALLAACATAPVGPPVAPPRFIVGDHWQYRVTDNMRRGAVSQIDAEVVALAGDVATLHVVKLDGELSAEELDLDIHDETLQARQPLKYEIEVERIEQSLLLRGRLNLLLDCECVRCLKPFKYRLSLDSWACHVPLEGEEAAEGEQAAPIVNDCVDLTPYLREDILLEFPQHPLCDAECHGLPHGSLTGKGSEPSTASSEAGSYA